MKLHSISRSYCWFNFSGLRNSYGMEIFRESDGRWPDLFVWWRIIWHWQWSYQVCTQITINFSIFVKQSILINSWTYFICSLDTYVLPKYNSALQSESNKIVRATFIVEVPLDWPNLLITVVCPESGNSRVLVDKLAIFVLNSKHGSSIVLSTTTRFNMFFSSLILFEYVPVGMRSTIGGSSHHPSQLDLKRYKTISSRQKFCLNPCCIICIVPYFIS